MKKAISLLFTIIFVNFLPTSASNFDASSKLFDTQDSSFNYKKIKSITLIKEYSSCSIYYIQDENGNSIINVIASISTLFLPDFVEALCKRLSIDPIISDAVYDVTSMIVSLRGQSIYRGISKGTRKILRWIGIRGEKESSAIIETRTFDIAEKIKDVFELYHESCGLNNGIPWSSVDLSSDNSTNIDGIYHSFHTYSSSLQGYISGDRVNFRTTPSIEKYNKIYRLDKYSSVEVLGFQYPETENYERILTKDSYLIDENREAKYKLPKGLAVKFISESNDYYSYIRVLKNNGEYDYGYVYNFHIGSMSNKKWYKIKYNNRIGWVYEDYIKVD